MFVVAMIAILVVAVVCESSGGRRAGRLAKNAVERTVRNLEQWAEREDK